MHAEFHPDRFQALRDDIAKLRKEIAQLREDVAQLRVVAEAAPIHHHYHYAPAPPVPLVPHIQPYWYSSSAGHPPPTDFS